MNDELRNQALESVRIDPLNLDKDILRLPTDYTKAAFEAADLRRRLDYVKSELDVAAADLDRKIRTDPETYGIERVSEVGIKNAILLQDEYKKVQRAVRDAQHKHDLAQAMVWAMEQKKRSLTLLVELHGLGYNASPRLSEQGKESLRAITKERIRSRQRARRDRAAD